MATEEESHQEEQAAWAEVDSQHMEAIRAHVEKHIGPIEWVFHELISDTVHLDIMFVAPTPQRNCYTLLTCGMSALPMTVPEANQQPENDRRYAELMLCLPPDWKLSEEAFRDENNYWPVRWLKTVGRLPHQLKTWVGPLHTVPNGAEAKPFAKNTRMGCWMLLYPLTTSDEFGELKYEDRVINFYGMVALHRDEMELRLAGEVPALLDAFGKEMVSELLSVARPSSLVPTKPNGFRFFRRK